LKGTIASLRNCGHIALIWTKYQSSVVFKKQLF